MSTPTAVKTAIVSRLATVLNPGSPTSPIKVVAHDGAFGADGKDILTVPGPASVLVAFMGCTAPAVEYEAPCVNADWVAVCVAKRPDAASGQATRGDVASDLAAVVFGHVARERWSSTASGRATRLQLRNESSLKAAKGAGASVWAVRWQQEIELTAEDVSGVLASLTTHQPTLSMGGDDTPNETATIEVTGGTLP